MNEYINELKKMINKTIYGFINTNACNDAPEQNMDQQCYDSCGNNIKTPPYNETIDTIEFVDNSDASLLYTYSVKITKYLALLTNYKGLADEQNILVFAHKIRQITRGLGITEVDLINCVLLIKKYTENMEPLYNTLLHLNIDSELLYLFVLILTITIKFSYDNPYFNDSITKMFDVNKTTFFDNELEIMDILKWDLSFLSDPYEYTNMVKTLNEL